ncbi:MAG: DUF4332 domain-containing protein, partial [Anaerolineae bacterium]|nr:DUF4332 domain-containing protein [Anaerolineae bacterium]
GAVAPPAAETGIAQEPADPAAGSGERPSNDTSGISPAVRAGTETVTTTTRDDLKQINGIGPKVAELLSSAGVKTFEQVATADVAQLRQVLDRAGSRYRIIDPTSWPAQARSLMELDQ